MASKLSPVEFRRMAPADLPLVEEWLTRPHLPGWWEGPIDLDPGVEQYLAFVDGEAVGYIQCYQAVTGHATGWWRDVSNRGVFGIDQFLADGARLGQGLGTRMVRAFVERLFEDPRVTRVQVDPSPANARAIRCYEKAGFRRAGQIVTPDGPALLMIVDRTQKP